jgi:hypothetical protein
VTIRVYYKVGATKTFENANGWNVDADTGGVSIIREEDEGDAALIAYVAGGVWETVVDADLQDEPFPSPPKTHNSGVVIR